MKTPSLFGKRRRCPRQKKAHDEGRTLVFVDESGFYLLPFVMRTYGPRGDTPIIKEFLTRDHLSAISGITPDGKLYMMVQDRAYKSPDVVDFLEHLLKHIPGKLLIVWDRSPIVTVFRISDPLKALRPVWLRKSIYSFGREVQPKQSNRPVVPYQSTFARCSTVSHRR